MSFPKLFSPVPLRGKTLKNRIVFGAHTANMGVDGLPSARHHGYYRERAKGGAAMIVVEPMPVHRTTVITRGNFRHADDSVIPHFRRITETCHGYGTVVLHQLYHVGAHGNQDYSWQPCWSPSGRPSSHHPNGSHAMTEAEIEEVIEAFLQAARRARDAGFDGVDLFAGYNGLIDQFWSPITNKRDDRWGGSVENRTRLAVEIAAGIRKRAGEDFIVGMTVTGADPQPGGLTIEDQQEIAAYLDGRGLVDYFSVGTGSYLNDLGRVAPSFQYGGLLGEAQAAKYKEAVRHALVTAESRIKTPANAEKILAGGGADLVSLVRAQIADPHLANKAREGRPEDIRPCISCNQLCVGRRVRDNWVSCLVNPSAGREFEWDGDALPHSESPRTVLVVGGGPAGLEVARVAAERGHKVILAEKTGELGGQFRLAAGQPQRGEIGELLTYYLRQLERLQVQVVLRKEMGAADVEAFDADVIVLATGARPSRDGYQTALPHIDLLPGVEQDNVCTIHDVLEGDVIPGTSVLLLDGLNGWWPASGTALHLALQRHWVTLVTSAEQPAASLNGSRTGAETRAKFIEFGVETLPSTVLLRWQGNTATLRNLFTEEVEERDFDSLVLATPSRPDNRLEAALAGSGREIHAIGDAVAARTASMAFFEARSLGLQL